MREGTCTGEEVRLLSFRGGRRRPLGKLHTACGTKRSLRRLYCCVMLHSPDREWYGPARPTWVPFPSPPPKQFRSLRRRIHGSIDLACRPSTAIRHLDSGSEDRPRDFLWPPQSPRCSAQMLALASRRSRTRSSCPRGWPPPNSVLHLGCDEDTQSPISTYSTFCKMCGPM